jgi:MOSC domain-containing protein YiiM
VEQAERRISVVQHFDRATLEAGLDDIRSSPKDSGRVVLICRRPETEQREVVDEAVLDAAEGLVGDNWYTRGSKATPDGSAHTDMQLTLMNVRSATVIAGDPERRQLAGDQFFVDLDLSVENLPPGSRLSIGEATIEITEIPHRGCGKFSSRFGVDALKFVNSEVGRELNLRGVNARIVEGGVVRTGDTITKATA